MGVLPFDKVGDVQRQGGALVRSGVPIAIWPAGEGAVTPVGEAYDFLAQAAVEAANDLVRQPNRQVVVDGITLKVIWAQRHDHLPHVELRLRELRPGG